MTAVPTIDTDIEEMDPLQKKELSAISIDDSTAISDLEAEMPAYEKAKLKM